MHRKLQIKRFISLTLAGMLAFGVIIYAIADRQIVFAGANGALHVTFTDDISAVFFMPGDEFSMTTSITGNTGFAAMIVRVYVPQGLELIGFDVYPQANFWAGFDAPENWDDDFAVSPAMTGYVRVGWQGRTAAHGNFTGNGNLFTHTFRVTGEIGIATAPITMAFANASYPFYELPTDVNFTPLDISLPGGVIGVGRVANLGRIRIGEPRLSVSAYPNHQTIINSVGKTVSFYITVSGMPAGQTFCLRNPDTNSSASIAVAVPPGIEVICSSITTDAVGEGSGRLTLRIYDEQADFYDLVSALSEMFPVIPEKRNILR